MNPESKQQLRKHVTGLLGRIQGKPVIHGDFVQYNYYSPYSPGETADKIMQAFESFFERFQDLQSTESDKS